MKSSTVSTILTILVLFISLIVLPVYFQGVMEYRNDLNQAQTASRNLVDKVIDSRELSDAMIRDFNLELATCTTDYEYKIWREVKQTNPTEDGGFHTQYVYSENLDEWHSGDIITIEVTQKNLSIFQRLSGVLMGSVYNKQSIRFAAMVR